MKYWRVWVVPAIAAAGFIAIYVLGANRSLFAALNQLGPATSDWLWANITVLGDTVVVFALCLPLWRRYPEALWAFVFVALLGTAWADGLKPLTDIDRPPEVLGDAVHVIGPAYRHHTFPSGHATAAFAIAGLYTLGTASRALAAVAIAIATLAALSRAVVGVHWPLDILGGAFGGWLAAVIAVAIAQRTRSFGTRPVMQWLLALFLAACAAWLVIGYAKSAYPPADLFQRAIGICCLGAAAARLKRAAA
ncbi:MAG TPA: phosphatase PAP2 family protein [Burkholderiales bacterium]|nr:phosphatase PAP2 family protein [Burkholderiales bacterium]